MIMRFLLVLICLFPAAHIAAQPAVLFVGSVHNAYVVKPLAAQGFAVDLCPAGKLADKLAGGRFNVVVGCTLNAADRQAAEAFLGRGGGVFLCNPESPYSNRDWTAMNQWLTAQGAQPRWESLLDTDPANLVSDVMGCKLSYTSRVSEPVSEGVTGVLTLVWNGTTGVEPPMSMDFGPDWTVVVRGAESLKGVAEQRNDPVLQPWIPKELAAPGPALMGIRQVGPGRLAVVGIREHWLFTSPGNCPTTSVMLSEGAGGRPSDWLKVFANTFRWLAEPSLKAGFGGATTPPQVLDPSVEVWPPPPVTNWHGENGVGQDEPQNDGLIGARTAISGGTGNVAEWVTAAKAAGLKFLVFLEDNAKLDQAGWDKLVADCKAASDPGFLAVPGLVFEDAQGDHMYAFADEVKCPRPSMLTPDRRLATTQQMRSRAWFDYNNEYMQQNVIAGWWNHAANFMKPVDYKLYNSFPIETAVDGKPVDHAMADYLYLTSLGGCQAPLAFEMMTRPDQVANRAAHGWRVVSHASLSALNGNWHRGAYSFSGSGAQYITNGPRILVWSAPACLSDSHGEWWRPDQWEWRVRLRVASDAGLKTVTLHDGDKEVFRRWLPAGAKNFEQELVLAQGRQRGLSLEVEDEQGRRAVSGAFYNRALIMEEFFCSDRCNFLGNARLKGRDGNQTWTQVSMQANMGITPSKGLLDLSASPAVNLTLSAPTLPIDGAPAGFPTYRLNFGPRVPGELPNLFAWPRNVLVGPELSVGQADIVAGYDPAEVKAEKTPLGYPYEQPQDGWGNSWGSWHHLVPTRKVTGWQRMTACNWLVGGFRIGWQDTRLQAKDVIPLGDQGLWVTEFRGELWRGAEKIAGYDTAHAAGPFTRGMYATLEDKGGAVVLIGTGNDLAYAYSKGALTLYFRPNKPALAKGDPIAYRVAYAGAGYGTTTARMVDFAHKYGVAEPGKPGYALKVGGGKLLDTYLMLHLDAGGQSAEAAIGKADLGALLPVCVEGLNDNWSVILQDRRRAWPNIRAIPVYEGRAWAELDPYEGDIDAFLGHPVVADKAEVKLLVSWQEPGAWFVEAHNPTDRSLRCHLSIGRGWKLFRFDERLELAPGTSRTWRVRE